MSVKRYIPQEVKIPPPCGVTWQGILLWDMRDGVTDRFLSNLYSEDLGHSSTCWAWHGARNQHGYGRIKVGRSYQSVHRLAYERFIGPINSGLDLDHICSVRHCANPDHLQPVTRSVNVRRGKATKLTVDDVYEIRQSNDRGSTLARKYGVTPQCIYGIRNRHSWKDL